MRRIHRNEHDIDVWHIGTGTMSSTVKKARKLVPAIAEGKPLDPHDYELKSVRTRASPTPDACAASWALALGCPYKSGTN